MRGNDVALTINQSSSETASTNTIGKKMIELIEKAWMKRQLPIIHGIVKGNGLYYKFEFLENQIEVAKPISFSFNFMEGDFSKIDPFFEMEINEYTLYCGEGSWGGDGFIYIENTETRKLLWCVFDDRINPIVKCEISGNKLIAKNNNEYLFIFELENPENLQYLPKLGYSKG